MQTNRLNVKHEFYLILSTRNISHSLLLLLTVFSLILSVIYGISTYQTELPLMTRQKKIEENKVFQRHAQKKNSHTATIFRLSFQYPERQRWIERFHTLFLVFFTSSKIYWSLNLHYHTQKVRLSMFYYCSLLSKSCENTTTFITHIMDLDYLPDTRNNK